jgi:hypothetical protein
MSKTSVACHSAVVGAIALVMIVLS